MNFCESCVLPAVNGITKLYLLMYVVLAFLAFRNSTGTKDSLKAFALWAGLWSLPGLLITGLVLVMGYRHKQVVNQAMQVFNERCKTAGEKIYKTVDNVEGVLLLKVRKRGGAGERRGQPDAAVYLHEFSEDAYIKNFLEYEADKSVRYFSSGRHLLWNKITTKPGYRFVDAVDPKYGKRYRYTLGGKTGFDLEKKETSEPPPPYAITYEDIVDPADRKYWVAGTHIKVLDTRNNEVLGEYIRYVVSKTQNTANRPWSFVTVCTEAEEKEYLKGNRALTRFFVSKVLHPVPAAQ